MTRVHVHKKPSHSRQVPDFVSSLRSLLPELRGRYGVRSLGLFGSYARGSERPESDLDVLVEFDRVPTLFRLVEIQDYLSDRLGIEVDLVLKDSLRPSIAERVLPEVIPI